jgi:hypothetical protein
MVEQCEYCGIIQDDVNERCQACNAPLPEQVHVGAIIVPRNMIDHWCIGETPAREFLRRQQQRIKSRGA